MVDQGSDAALLAQIKADLRAQGQFVRHMPETDPDGIDRIRRVGRRAGRELGWTIRTLVTDLSHREDRKVGVFVVAVESNPLHQQLMQIRGDKAIRRAFDSWSFGGTDG